MRLNSETDGLIKTSRRTQPTFFPRRHPNDSANRHTKRRSTPLIIGEMQIASAARCRLTPVRTAAARRRQCKGAGTLARCRGTADRCSHRGKPPPAPQPGRSSRKCRRDVQERRARAPRTAHGGHGTEASRVPVDGRDAAAHPVMTRYSASREKDTLPCETARGAPGGVRHVGREKADGRDELCAIALTWGT